MLFHSSLEIINSARFLIHFILANFPYQNNYSITILNFNSLIFQFLINWKFLLILIFNSHFLITNFLMTVKIIQFFYLIIFDLFKFF